MRERQMGGNTETISGRGVPGGSGQGKCLEGGGKRRHERDKVRGKLDY